MEGAGYLNSEDSSATPPTRRSSDELPELCSLFEAAFIDFMGNWQHQPNGTASTGSFDASVEQIRGASFSPPVFQLEDYGRPVEHELSFEEEEEIDDELPLERPLEERRRVPGCGINHFDNVDNAVRAETSPIRRNEIFGLQTVRSYARHPPRPRHRLPISHKYGVAAALNAYRAPQQESPHPSALLQNTGSLQMEREQQRQRQFLRDPRYPALTRPLSPYSSSSSSSSCSSTPPLYNQFRPTFQSSALQTPPHQITGGLSLPPNYRKEDQHPAFIPTFIVRTPENYISPTSTGSPPSFMSATPPQQQTCFVHPKQHHQNHNFGATYSVNRPSSASRNQFFSSEGNSRVRRQLFLD